MVVRRQFYIETAPWIFTEFLLNVVPYNVINGKTMLGLGDGLVQTWQLAIIWTNDDSNWLVPIDYLNLLN